ncbi:MAG: tRNA 2-thiouridine(34) synthase MnmA, partial [Oligoflexia bacterium]|nr:tRNA 2-thiouridine(34) synthase MnmA [Oligoflexia bacterium]
LIVGERDDLLVKEFEAENINIFDRLCFDGKTPLDIQLRYRSAPVRGSISITGGDRFAVKLAEAAYGITPGQAVVAYREDRIVGGGWIS